MLGSHIRALLLDLDDTLLDNGQAMTDAADLTAREIGTAHGFDASRLGRAYIEAANEVWSSLGWVPARAGLSDGMAVRVEAWSRALSIHGVRDRLIAIQAAEVYAAARRATYVLFDEVVPFLEAAPARWKLAIVTNGAGDGQREKVAATGLGRFVEHVVIAGEVGAGKPEPAIFEAALRLLDVPASAAVHVGDSHASDVVGAHAAGVMPVWLVRGEASSTVGDGEPVLTIRSLSELLDE